MMDLLGYGVVLIVGGAIGFLIAALMDTSRGPKEDANIPNAPTVAFATKKLQRHTLSVAILEDRYVDDPVETVAKVKKEFANEIVKLVEDNIEVENDRYSNHIKFYVDIWTKEAADGNISRDSNISNH